MASVRAENRIEVREDLAPIYIVSFIGVPSDADFDAYLARLTRLTQRLEQRALIYDATRAGPTPASQRKKQADWMKANEAVTRASTVGCAFVLPSTIMRGVLTAILWLQPMACPHSVVATLPEALEWTRERLLERGPKLPDSLGSPRL